MKLRVGLIGLGPAWESRHRPALRALGDRFEVRAVCEQVAHRAEQVAREHRAAQVDGFRALARREDIDAIMLLAKQWYGPQPIFAACDAGKAIYCGTGFGPSPETAARIKQRVEQAGIAFMAEFPRRHAPATVRLKELIATRLGPPRLLFCHLRVNPDHRALPGEGDSAAANNALSDMVELVDWCRYVVGREPTSVFGAAHRNPSGEEDYQMMSLDFATDDSVGSGATAQISCGRYMPSCWTEAMTFRPPAALQVACEEGVAFIDLPSTLVWFDRAGRQMESLEHERPVGELMLSQFVRSVTRLVRDTSSLEDAYRAHWIVHQARESFVQGRRMDLRD